MGKKSIVTMAVTIEVDVDEFDESAEVLESDLLVWAELMLTPGQRPLKWFGIAWVAAIGMDWSCQWSARCEREATVIVKHPTLGMVSCCARCSVIAWD